MSLSRLKQGPLSRLLIVLGAFIGVIATTHRGVAASDVPQCRQLFSGSYAASAAVQDADELDLSVLQHLLSPEELAAAPDGGFSSYTLADFINTKGDDALIKRMPTHVMNADQRLDAVLNIERPYEIKDPLYGIKPYKVWPVLSDGHPLAGGLRVIGQHAGLQVFMEMLSDSTLGDGARKAILDEGPPGTGKSVKLSIVTKAAERLYQQDPRFRLLTARWKDVERIPGVAALARKKMVRLPDGTLIKNPIESEMRRSPLTVLPKETQDRLIAAATPEVKKLIGTAPIPFLHPDPKDAEIRDSLYKHYGNGKKLTLEQKLAILNKHLDVIYRPPLKPVLIAAQGDEPDEDSLTFAEDPVMMAMNGPSHPFSYYYTGRIPSADGSGVNIDEALRNKGGFLSILLHLIQDSELQRGGSPTVPLDVRVILAANTESIDDALLNKQIRAFLDRARRVEFLLTIHPWEVLKIAYLQRKGTIEVAPLPAARAEVPADWKDGEWRKAELDQLVTNPDREGVMKPPHGRFAVRAISRDNEPAVFISPWAMEFMAMIVSASRQANHVESAAQIGGKAMHVLKEPEFHDPVQRLRVILRERSLPAPMLKELHDLSMMLKEGSKGISNRDITDTWMPAVINEARKPGNGNTVTPTLVLDVLKTQFKNGGIKATEEEKMRWERLAYRIGGQIVAQYINNDMLTAMSHGQELLIALYEELIDTMQQLSNFNPDTQGRMPISQFKDSRTGAMKPIDYERLEKVKKAYRDITGKELNYNFIVTEALMMDRAQVQNGSAKRTYYQPLMSAIAKAVSSSMISNLPSSGSEFWDRITRYLRSGEGDSQTSADVAGISSVMINELGYNDFAMLQAVEFVKDMQRNNPN